MNKKKEEKKRKQNIIIKKEKNMRKVENSEVTSGRIYDISDLSLKTVQNEESKYFGTQFITGSLDVATDEEG